MERVLMRVMTLKSVLGFGYNNVREKTVGRLMELGKHKLLIECYYGLEKINFIPDVLKTLGIQEIIDKPGRVNDKVLKKQLVELALSNLSNDVIREIDKRKELSRDKAKNYSKSILRDSFVKYRKKLVLRNFNQKG